LNVLFVIHYPVFGGPHNQAMLLAPALAKRGVRTTVLLPDERSDESGSAASRLRAAGLDIVTLPLGRVRATFDPRRQFRFASRLQRDVSSIRALIREREIEMIQIGGLVNPQAAVAGRREGVPVIWQILDTRPPVWVRRALMPIVRRYADVVMTTGKAVADVHPGAVELGDRLRVFYPPVDPETFRRELFDRTAARRDFGLPADELVVGSVGNLNPQKGHEYLLAAAAAVRKELPGLRVLLVGASHETHRAYERRLHDLCRTVGMRVGKDVVFAGGLEDVRPALAAMDVFALSSVPLSEGAPTAIEEAMMMQLPVVATNVGAVHELVEDGTTGYVVPARKPGELAAALGRVLGSSTSRAEFGRRGREVAVATFSVEECARTHFEAYEQARVINSGRVRSGGDT